MSSTNKTNSLSPPPPAPSSPSSSSSHSSSSSWIFASLVSLSFSLISFLISIHYSSSTSSYHHDSSSPHTMNIPSIISLIIIFIGVPFTHSLGSKLFPSNDEKKISELSALSPSSSSSSSSSPHHRHSSSHWSFFQPFKGGYSFVVFQAMGWAFYSLTIVGFLYVLYKINQFSAFFLNFIGIGGLIAHILVFISLDYFRGKTEEEEEEEEQQEGKVENSSIDKRRKILSANRGWSFVFSGSGLLGIILTIFSLAVQTIFDSQQIAVFPSLYDHSNNNSTSSSLSSSLSSVPSILSHTPVSPSHDFDYYSHSFYFGLKSSILLGVPLSHILTGRRAHRSYSLFQPFRGGAKFVLLQALSWTLWTFAILATVAATMEGGRGGTMTMTVMGMDMMYYGGSYMDFIKNNVMNIDMSTIPLNINITAFLCFASQGLLLLSLKYFDSNLSMRVGSCGSLMRKQSEWKRKGKGAVEGDKEKEKEGMGTINKERDNLPTRSVVTSSTISPSTNIPSTINPPTSSSPSSSSPSWRSLRFPLHSHDFLSHLHSPSSLLRLSLDDFSAAIHYYHSLISYRAAWDFIVVGAFYLIPIVGAITCFTPFLLLHHFSHIWWVPPIVVTIAALYSLSFASKPHITGKWAWGKMRDNEKIWDCFERYFDFKMIEEKEEKSFVWEEKDLVEQEGLGNGNGNGSRGARDTGSPSVSPDGETAVASSSPSSVLASSLSSSSSLSSHSPSPYPSVPPSSDSFPLSPPYIMCFHPHGIYPTTLLWATRGSTWKRHFPRLLVDVCGASIMFFAPILREVILWSGARDVSKQSILYSLQKLQRSVVLIPGGQREMNMSFSSPYEISLFARHTGFVKLSLQTGCPIVPIFSFGEWMTLDNVHFPTIQMFFLKKIGFGFPVLPYGKFLSPLPNNHRFGITMVVGKPIRSPKVENPSKEVIEKLHRQYYDMVGELFEKHKTEAGFPDCKLKIVF